MFHSPSVQTICPYIHTDATKITLAPSNADINQGENVTLQCHASHDPTMDLTFTWALNGVLLDLEVTAGPFHRVEGVSCVVGIGEGEIRMCAGQLVVASVSWNIMCSVNGQGMGFN